jgi:hypothetical protein
MNRTLSFLRLEFWSVVSGQPVFENVKNLYDRLKVREVGSVASFIAGAAINLTTRQSATRLDWKRRELAKTHEPSRAEYQAARLLARSYRL